MTTQFKKKKKSVLVQQLANQKAGHILLAVLNTLSVMNSPWLCWQFKQVCFILPYNINWVPFQSRESIFNLKFLKAPCHQPSGYLHSGREDGSPSDFYFLKWLWCTYDKLLLRTLPHKAPTYRQMDSPAAGPASLASTREKVNWH